MRNLVFVALLLCASAALGANLSKADAAAVRKVQDQYISAWLAGDSIAVMRQLTPDSVLIAGDKTPYVGAAAIHGYWWPPGAPKFVLDRYTTTIDEISGSGDLAVMRGTQIIEWTSGKERWRTRGNYLTVLRRTSRGWLIATQMAANLPNQRIP